MVDNQHIFDVLMALGEAWKCHPNYAFGDIVYLIAAQSEEYQESHSNAAVIYLSNKDFIQAAADYKDVCERAN